MVVLRLRVVLDPQIEGGFGPRMCIPTHKQHMEWTQYYYTNIRRAISKRVYDQNGSRMCMLRVGSNHGSKVMIKMMT